MSTEETIEEMMKNIATKVAEMRALEGEDVDKLYPTHIVETFEKFGTPVHKLPMFDNMDDLRGDYIDNISYKSMSSPVMRFIASGGRPGILIRAKYEDQYYTIALHQRYSDCKHWGYAFGESNNGIQYSTYNKETQCFDVDCFHVGKGMTKEYLYKVLTGEAGYSIE